MSAAARLLHLSQPAVTAQVRQLEEECGCALFVRSARGVALTDAGRRLLQYAVRVDELLSEAGADVAGEGAAGGEVVLAASQTVAATVVPLLLQSFRRVEPATAIRVEVGNTAHVQERVAEGKVPLGLVEGPLRGGRVRIEPYLDDELLPVVSAAAAPALAAPTRAAHLAHVPIVWREIGSGSREVVERALRRVARRRPQPGDLQLGSNEAVKGAVLLGLGVGFLSRWAVRGELASGALRALPVADLRIPRAFSWALPAGGVAGAAGRFLAHARRSPPSR